MPVTPSPSPQPASPPGPVHRAIFHAFLIAVGVLRCGLVLLVPVLAAVFAGSTDQGLDAAVATAAFKDLFGQGMYAYAGLGLMVALCTLSALVVLEPQLMSGPVEQGAAHTAAGLVGLAGGFIPLAVFEWHGLERGDDGFWIIMSSLVPLAFVLGWRDLVPRLGRRAGGGGRVARPLIAVMLSFLAILVVAGIDHFPFKAPALVMFVLTALGLLVADRWLGPGAPSGAAGTAGVWLRLLSGASLVAGIVLASFPAPIGIGIGTFATLMFGLDAWLGFGILVWRIAAWLAVQLARGGRRWQLASQGLPFGWIASAGLGALFLTGPFGSGVARRLDPGTPPPAAGAPDMQAHARAWLEARRTEIDGAPGRYPVFLVTADGGGVRAAWWSAALLTGIEERATGFSRHIFAMSGVSGGSLGIATFAAQAAQVADLAAGSSPGVCRGQGWLRCATEMLGTDLLAPALAATLTRDAPRAILRTWFLDDRAAAHEQGFETAWRNVADTDVFGEPFTALWRGSRQYAVPLLLLNATDARTGRRMVLSPVGMPGADAEWGELRPLLGGAGVRLSTAVLLSARFPAVSPEAWLPVGPEGRGHAIVDGGFADNSGARSAMLALHALQLAAASLGLDGKIRPVAIMIANDPTLGGAAVDLTAPGPRETINTLGSLGSPVLTLDRLRQANTARAKQALIEAVCTAGGVVLNDLMLHEDEGVDRTAFPLGWMLADRTVEALTKQARALWDRDSGSSRAASFVRGGVADDTMAGLPCPIAGGTRAPSAGARSAGP